MNISGFTIWLLGLESSIFLKVDASEQNKYKRVAICFLLLMFVFILSVHKFFEAAFDYQIVVFIVTIVFSLIAFAMYRFSLITYRRSVFDGKQQSQQVVIENPIENQSNNATQHENRINKKAFISSMFLRLIIFTPLSFVIVFGITSYFKASLIENICYKKSQSIKTEEIQLLQANCLKSTNSIRNRIKDLQIQIERLDKQDTKFESNYASKINEIQIYEDQILNNSNALNEEINKIELSSQKVHIFLILVFQEFLRGPFFWIVFNLFTVFFYWLHYQLYVLKVSTRYTYALLSTEAYKDIILANFKILQTERQMMLIKYNQLENSKQIAQDIWLDAPFCQHLKLSNPNYTKVPFIQLQNVLNSEQQNEI